MGSFIVVYYGGTGSSWLMNVLGSIPRVLVTAYEPLENWHWKAPPAEKLAWLETAVSLPDSGDEEAVAEWAERLAASPQFRRVTKKRFDRAGFKMTIDAIADHESLLATLRGAGTRLIVLERQNRIKHALSLYRSHEERKNQFRYDGPAPPSVVVLETFDEWVAHAEGWHAATGAFAAAARSGLGDDRVLTLAYEDLLSEKDAAIRRACAHLGVDPDRIQSDGGYKKATPDDLRASIVNYDEVEGHYRDTPLAACFA